VMGAPVNQPVDIAKVIAGICSERAGERDDQSMGENRPATCQMGRNAGWAS
jgi:hypothetical protein